MVVLIGNQVGAHTHAGTDIVSPVPIAQLPVAANGVVDSGRLLSSGDGRIAPLFSPEDHGLKAWTFDPYLAVLSTTPPANGYLLATLIEVREQITVNNIGWAVTTAGATATSGQSRLGIWRASDRALVAQTGDVSGSITSVGLKQTALAASVVLPPGFYYVGIYTTASTRPALTCGTGVVAQYGRTTTNARAGQVSTVYTTALPTTLPTFSLLSAGAPWFGLN